MQELPQPVHVKDPPAEFAKSRLLGDAAEANLLGNTTFILLAVALKIADISRYNVA